MNTINTYHACFFIYLLKCEGSEENFGEEAAKAILGEYL
jgi:hypothetical protein